MFFLNNCIYAFVGSNIKEWLYSSTDFAVKYLGQGNDNKSTINKSNAEIFLFLL